ncbi:hypothetical protein EV424DRAFT_1420299 [Suillus variegatus]|nr:hypothetical protein EV424DRAFT_1420299 [Suillus variegatus]
MRWLRVNLLPSFSYFPRENVTPGNGSDDPKAVLDSPPSGTDPESSYVTSPSGSLSTFEDPAVACEAPSCESDFRSLMQHCPKMEVDFKRYGEEPENLTAHISRTQKYPHSNGGFGNIWKCILKNSFLRNGTKVSPQDVAVKSLIVQSRRPEDIQELIKVGSHAVDVYDIYHRSLSRNCARKSLFGKS